MAQARRWHSFTRTKSRQPCFRDNIRNMRSPRSYYGLSRSGGRRPKSRWRAIYASHCSHTVLAYLSRKHASKFRLSYCGLHSASSATCRFPDTTKLIRGNEAYYASSYSRRQARDDGPMPCLSFGLPNN